MVERTGLLDRPEFHILRALSRAELLRIDVERARGTHDECPLAQALLKPIEGPSSVAPTGSVRHLCAGHFLSWFDAGLEGRRLRPRPEKRARLAAAIRERLAELGEGAP